MRCVITDILPETSDTQTYRLNASLDFKAGQAISLLIPGDPKKRYYSLSSSPTEKGYLSITIKADDKARALFASLFTLQKGSEVEIGGPMGSMTLPEPLQGPFYFLAAGSGVTPFRSMIKFILDTQPATDTWLFHSVKLPDDLLFKDEFLAWSKTSTFRYIPTFTRYSDADETVTTGRIGDVLLRKHISPLEGTFFLSGPKEFVKDMEHVLLTLKVPTERIRREQW